MVVGARIARPRTADHTRNLKDPKFLANLAAQAGLDTTGRSLPNGFETVLSRDFNGVDFRGTEPRTRRL